MQKWPREFQRGGGEIIYTLVRCEEQFFFFGGGDEKKNRDNAFDHPVNKHVQWMTNPSCSMGDTM